MRTILDVVPDICLDLPGPETYSAQYNGRVEITMGSFTQNRVLFVAIV